MLNVWVTEGIKKWFGPLRETPPSPPDKYPPWPPPPKVLFMDTIKGKTEPSRQGGYLSGGEGGGFPKGADHFFIPSPPLNNRRSAILPWVQREVLNHTNIHAGGIKFSFKNITHESMHNLS